jgi:CubicO group peptidase (beta-lactamase class C family)
MRIIRNMAISLLPIAVGLAQAQSSPTAKPDWPKSSPAEQAQDAKTFGGLSARIDEKLADIRSVVVVQRGRIVFEYNRSGLTQDSLQSVESVTKSVLSLLVGIAHSQGQLPDLDRPIVDVMPELGAVNSDPRARAVTVRHLLTMTAGFQSSERSFFDPNELAHYAMSRKFAADPGAVFRYDNPGSNLLAAVLGKAVGEEPGKYAQRLLFEPLGIDPTEWETDFQGHSLGFRGLKLRVRDLAKLGQLLLQNGEWEGRRLIPADYIATATERQNNGGPPVGLAYGYMWWIPRANSPRTTFIASGSGGQILWVHTPLNLVVAVTSEVTEASTARNQAIDLIRKEIFQAALKSPLGPAISP